MHNLNSMPYEIIRKITINCGMSTQKDNLIYEMRTSWLPLSKEIILNNKYKVSDYFKNILSFYMVSKNLQKALAEYIPNPNYCNPHLLLELDDFTTFSVPLISFKITCSLQEKDGLVENCVLQFYARILKQKCLSAPRYENDWVDLYYQTLSFHIDIEAPRGLNFFNAQLYYDPTVQIIHKIENTLPYMNNNDYFTSIHNGTNVKNLNSSISGKIENKNDVLNRKKLSKLLILCDHVYKFKSQYINKPNRISDFSKFLKDTMMSCYFTSRGE